MSRHGKHREAWQVVLIRVVLIVVDIILVVLLLAFIFTSGYGLATLIRRY